MYLAVKYIVLCKVLLYALLDRVEYLKYDRSSEATLDTTSYRGAIAVSYIDRYGAPPEASWHGKGGLFSQMKADYKWKCGEKLLKKKQGPRSPFGRCNII